MVFNSVAYAIFFPIVAIVYLCLGVAAGNVWLLLSSYFFYMSADVRYGAILFGASLVTYFVTNILGNIPKNAPPRRIILIIGVIIELSLLFFFKYFDFFNEITGVFFEISFLLPVGISFYIFQAVGYIIDVYREDVEPERNFIRAMLYISFFPGLLSGPISRAGELMPQFRHKHKFEYGRVREGLIRMSWGLFLKIVIASRLSIVADLVYDHYNEANALQLIIGTVAYALQIYCDFSSYSELAIGSAECMGFTLRENFSQPFFAVSCAELWRRWHMSLMTWFKDYLYIPLGGSRKGRARKLLNVLIVFTVSGLWHGAAWTYVLWGFISGLFQVMGELLKGMRERVVKASPFKGRAAAVCHHAAKIVITFALFNIALVFFRAESISQAMDIFGTIFTKFGLNDFANTNVFQLGLGVYNFVVLIFALGMLLVVDIIRETRERPEKAVVELARPVRWGVYYLVVVMILLSTNIGAQSFIYFKF